MMKQFLKRHTIKISSTFLLLLLTFSCSENTTGSVHIAGTADQNHIILTRIEQVVAETTTDNSNGFDMTIENIARGYYTINDQVIYLAPGYDLKINLTKPEVAMTGENANEYAGEGAKENNFLVGRLNDLNDYHYLSEEITPLYDEMDLVGFKQFLEALETKFNNELHEANLDEKFTASEKTRIQQLTAALLINYTMFHGMDLTGEAQLALEEFAMSLTPEDFEDPKNMAIIDSLFAVQKANMLPAEVVTPITDVFLANFDWNDEELYSMNSIGYQFLYDQQVLIASYASRTGKENEPLEISKRNVVLDSISSQPIRLSLLTNLTELIIKVHSKEAEDAYTVFNTQNGSALQKEQIETAYKNYKNMIIGGDAVKFVNYKTIDDKNVSLDDLLGKYVYIDVWATWCGPCKKEIPFLKELEKNYHDKDIEFVSISVDTEKDRQKWKDMVKDMELKGVQIMADNEMSSTFIKAYNIISIPRFLLIDPEGKLLSADAPRPSDEGTKLLLDGLLL